MDLFSNVSEPGAIRTLRLVLRRMRLTENDSLNSKGNCADHSLRSCFSLSLIIFFFFLDYFKHSSSLFSSKLDLCILASNCKVGEKCVLKDCDVGPGAVVPAGTNAKGEKYSVEEEDGDEEDDGLVGEDEE